MIELLFDLAVVLMSAMQVVRWKDFKIESVVNKM